MCENSNICANSRRPRRAGRAGPAPVRLLTPRASGSRRSEPPDFVELADVALRPEDGPRVGEDADHMRSRAKTPGTGGQDGPAGR